MGEPVEASIPDIVKDALKDSVRAIARKWIVRESIDEELRNTDDPVIGPLYEHLLWVEERVDDTYLSKTIGELGRFGLWMLLDDGAYRHPLLAFLARVVTDRRIETGLHHVNLPRPEHWYPNLGKKAADEAKDTGSNAGLYEAFDLSRKSKELAERDNEEIQGDR